MRSPPVQPEESGATRPPAHHRWLRRTLSPLVSVAAILYFLIDAVLLAAIRPLLVWLSRQPLVIRVEHWVGSLGPYPTLALLLVPLAMLEPAKPLGIYLMAIGHPLGGVLLIGGAELLKLVTIERLFRTSRSKLLTIPWFAWGYGVVVRWLARIRALPAWRAVVRAYARVKDAARRLLRHARELP
ncbi:MAG TPA: hypothetical protein VD978_01240 [Azospirillum sp.]|nr:hypothetical protein [Azospirillum sp.]